MAKAVAKTPALAACSMRWGTMTGSRMYLPPSTVNGMELGDQEWRESLFWWYVINTPGLPPNFSCCRAAFSISHALYCKKVGLITTRHTYLCYEVSYLDVKAFNLYHMQNNPPI